MTDNRYSPASFADAWLSVACASGAEKDRPAMHRTVLVEQFDDRGVRLVSTDGYMLLHAWVSTAGQRRHPEPGLEEAPDRVAVAMDLDGRAKGLFGYVRGAVSRGEESPDLGTLAVSVGDLADDPSQPGQLDGMAVTYVSFELPNRERLQLPIFEGKYPDWRQLFDGFLGAETERVALGAEVLKRLAKLMGLWDGCQLRWLFGGHDRGARVEVHSEDQAIDVTVTGLAMPCRWDVDLNQPWEDPDDDPDDGVDDGTVVAFPSADGDA